VKALLDRIQQVWQLFRIAMLDQSPYECWTGVAIVNPAGLLECIGQGLSAGVIVEVVPSTVSSPCRNRYQTNFLTGADRLSRLAHLGFERYLTTRQQYR